MKKAPLELSRKTLAAAGSAGPTATCCRRIAHESGKHKLDFSDSSYFKYSKAPPRGKALLLSLLGGVSEAVRAACCTAPLTLQSPCGVSSPFRGACAVGGGLLHRNSAAFSGLLTRATFGEQRFYTPSLSWIKVLSGGDTFRGKTLRLPALSPRRIWGTT